MTLELGVLISGRGSNLQAILDAIGSGWLDARVRLVIANRTDAPGLDRARAAGVPASIVDHRGFRDRPSFESALLRQLQNARCEWIVLAGFDRVLTRTFLDVFRGHVLNVHPSLLPAFPGLGAQARALASGARVTGCTVHLVEEEVDSGPILGQETVPILDEDTPEALSARILEREHVLLVQVLKGLETGAITLPDAATDSP